MLRQARGGCVCVYLFPAQNTETMTETFMRNTDRFCFLQAQQQIQHKITGRRLRHDRVLPDGYRIFTLVDAGHGREGYNVLRLSL